MAQTQNQGDAEITIRHNQDGWVFQFVEYLEEEKAVIYQCPACQQYLKISLVSLVDPPLVENVNAGMQPLVQSPETQATTISENPQVTQPEESPKKKSRRA